MSSGWQAMVKPTFLLEAASTSSRCASLLIHSDVLTWTQVNFAPCCRDLISICPLPFVCVGRMHRECVERASWLQQRGLPPPLKVVQKKKWTSSMLSSWQCQNVLNRQSEKLSPLVYTVSSGLDPVSGICGQISGHSSGDREKSCPNQHVKTCQLCLTRFDMWSFLTQYVNFARESDGLDIFRDCEGLFVMAKSWVLKTSVFDTIVSNLTQLCQNFCRWALPITHEVQAGVVLGTGIFTDKHVDAWVLDSGATSSATFDERDCVDVCPCEVRVTGAGGDFTVRWAQPLWPDEQGAEDFPQQLPHLTSVSVRVH